MTEIRIKHEYQKKPKLTKKERRELQERQRAEKALKKSQKQVKSTRTNQNRNQIGSKESKKKHVVAKSQAQKTVSMFNHIYQYERVSSLTSDIGFSNQDTFKIHPSILRVGLKYAEHQITGSNARTVSMLSALRDFIQDYQTPLGTVLARNLDGSLKPLIQFLIDCRPHDVAMGNAIKHIRHLISTATFDADESEIKRALCEEIDRYIETNIVAAQDMIAAHGMKKICDGDVVLTYSYSTAVYKVLSAAVSNGVTFKVVVVSARPNEAESKKLVHLLSSKNIVCLFINMSSISFIMSRVTKVVLGGCAFFSNGAALGPVGTSSIALVAQSFQKPVMFCAETYKFSQKVHLNGISYNELADPDEILLPSKYGPDGTRLPDICSDWRDSPYLKLLNLVYDLTSMDLITVVITEVGLIPPTSVPVIVREQSELLESSGLFSK